MRKLAAALLVLMLAGVPAGAADNSRAYSTIVQRAIENVIRPGYGELATRADLTRSALESLCAAPSPQALSDARSRFGDLVEAWSAIELIRFGPVRERNRLERLNYWPDRKGRGLRQVQRILAETDASARDPAALQKKSVAVQGLGALEFVLFGTGSPALAGAPSGYRCAYGASVAGAIAMTSAALATDWRDEAGYSAIMLKPGPDNPVYRSDAEAVQDLLRALNEELQFVRDLKIGRVFAAEPQKAKPKRAPFWRSGLTLRAIEANIRSLQTLFDKAGMGDALGADDAWLAGAVGLDAGKALKLLGGLHGTVAEIAGDDDRHRQVYEAGRALDDLAQTLGEYYPEASGLNIGFNSLDGD